MMLLFGLGQVSGQFGLFRPTPLRARFSQSQQLDQRVKAVNRMVRVRDSVKPSQFGQAARYFDAKTW
ncbi:hypothetical protein Hanom_Chr13g01205601 [Helianthus anomalus]